MNTVNVREFQRNMYRWLEKLPIVVTKNSKPLFTVATYSENKELEQDNVVTVHPDYKRPDYAVKVAIGNVPTRKIKLDKKGYCPHFILGGNSCRSCNEN